MKPRGTPGTTVMIEKINISVSEQLINDALKLLPSFDFRITINQPTGNFYYDPWVIKDQFRNTIWETLLDTLPFPHGEARLVNLLPKETYKCHSDIDDRWHLALTNEKSYLIDLESETMYSCRIGEWYSMNAGILHTAANFGNTDRFHLLVRKLLTRPVLKDPVEYTIQANIQNRVPHRYIFDQLYGPLLNRLNKEEKLENFVRNLTHVTFKTEKDVVIPEHKDFIIKTS